LSDALRFRDVGKGWRQPGGGEREVSLDHLRDRKGATDFARGTLAAADALVRYLDSADWRFETIARWRPTRRIAVHSCPSCTSGKARSKSAPSAETAAGSSAVATSS